MSPADRQQGGSVSRVDTGGELLSSQASLGVTGLSQPGPGSFWNSAAHNTWTVLLPSSVHLCKLCPLPKKAYRPLAPGQAPVSVRRHPLKGLFA